MENKSARCLGLILGDQLDHSSPLFDRLDKKMDALWMTENDEEMTHRWCHKLRLAYFFSAMRHHREWLESRGWCVKYHALTFERDREGGLEKDVRALNVKNLLVVQPGNFRVLDLIRSTAERLNIKLEILEDTHFLCTIGEFRKYRSSFSRGLPLERFYRWMRKREDLLLTGTGKPAGGKWNFDVANRETFGKKGPGVIKVPRRRFTPDETTLEVVRMVDRGFTRNPGSLENFTLPITRPDALAFLGDFVEHRLPNFGKYEDAMWTTEPFLYHSRLSALLNVKLLHPREVIKEGNSVSGSRHGLRLQSEESYRE